MLLLLFTLFICLLGYPRSPSTSSAPFLSTFTDLATEQTRRNENEEMTDKFQKYQ